MTDAEIAAMAEKSRMTRLARKWEDANRKLRGTEPFKRRRPDAGPIGAVPPNPTPTPPAPALAQTET